MVSVEIDITIEYRGEEIDIPCVGCGVYYDYAPDQKWAPNGDPGEPGYEELDVTVDMDESVVVEIVTEHFVAEGRTVPAWVQDESSSILHRIEAETYDRVRNRLCDYAG